MATLCISGDAIIKAGENVDSSVPATAWDGFIEEAEAYLCGLTKYDIVTNWPTLSGEPTSPMLKEYCARDAAIQGIAYNTTGYGSLQEAEDMINIHAWRINQIIKLLENPDIQDFMKV